MPARSARVGVVDQLFSRVGASDDLSQGKSTFMVEMEETALILNRASARSLVIVDEIGSYVRSVQLLLQKGIETPPHRFPLWFECGRQSCVRERCVCVYVRVCVRVSCVCVNCRSRYISQGGIRNRGFGVGGVVWLGGGEPRGRGHERDWHPRCQRYWMPHPLCDPLPRSPDAAGWNHEHGRRW